MMPDNHTINALLNRRSVLIKNLIEPGPNQEQLDTILAAAHRVPDHGKIGPWRFIIFSGERRLAFGEALQTRFAKLHPEASEALIEAEAQRFMRAPLVIGVVSSPIKHKVPKWEQELSAGAVCQNILHACHALGYGAQWVTEWYAFDDTINQALKLEDSERIAGFIYIGSFDEAPNERVRPELATRISHF